MTALTIRGARAAPPVRADGLRPWLLAWAAQLPFFAIIACRLNESDTFWEIRTGLWILEHGRIPTHDPFSWTVAGRPWTLNSWGFDLLLGLLYRAGGLAAVATASAVLAAVAVALVLALSQRLGVTPAVAGTVSGMVTAVILPWLSARPQAVDYVALPLLVLLLEHVLTSTRPLRWSTASIGTVLVWGNLHSAASLGVAVIAAAAVATAVRPCTRPRAPLMIATAGGGLGVLLVNPYGAAIVSHAGEVRSSSVSITEWQPLSLTDPIQDTVALVGVIALVVCARRRLPVMGAAVALCLIGSVLAIRNLPLLALLAVAPVAALATPVGMRHVAGHPRILCSSAAAVVLSVCCIAAVRLPLLGVPLPSEYPARLLASLPAGKVATDYLQGGWVMLERPDVLVSLDSRNDLYGASTVADLERLMRGDGDLSRLQQCDAVLTTRGGRLASRLAQDGWRVGAADSGWVVLLPPARTITS